AVVSQVEAGELTYKEAQRRYGIQGRSTVLVWCRKYGLQDWQAPVNRRRTVMKQPSQPPTPAQRIKKLEAQLPDSRHKTALFEAVIDLMRKEYGITVKKPSGRPSRNNP